MQNTFVQVRDDQIIFDKSDLIMYAVLAAVLIVIIVVVIVALKRRKKDFIKTLPTNLKEDK